MLGKMSIMDFMHQLIIGVGLFDTEKQLWQEEPSENPSPSVLAFETTHTQSQERTSLPEPMIPLRVPDWQGQWWGMEIMLILLVSTWLHQAPQGLGMISVEWDAHYTAQRFWSPSNTQQHWSPSLFAGDFDLLSDHTSHLFLSLPIVFYRVKKVLHPNNVN